MDNTVKIATFPRHGHLVTAFFPNIWEMFKRKEVYHLQEEQILSFKGKKYSGEEKLIDIDYLENKSDYISYGIDVLDFVQPDFLFFKDNKFLQNQNGLRTIGIPDLVVEVWSINNDKEEREFKTRLYSSSNKCEHWYLEQDSNYVKCMIGDTILPTQNLHEVLLTQKGIRFDLRNLAL